MNTPNYPPPVGPSPRSILELLADVLSVPAANEEEARIRLQVLRQSYPSRKKEVVSYLMGSANKVFIHRRGGGADLFYILWWFRDHARDDYERVGKLAIKEALDNIWPLEKGYEPLSRIKEIQPFLPPPPETKKGNFTFGGMNFMLENNLLIAVNVGAKDLWQTAIKKGALVYVWSADKHVEIRVDGRSGLGFPDLSPEWSVMRRNKKGLPTYCRLSRRASDDEMYNLIDYIWKKSDRRNKLPEEK
jgi:hypothetical protein